MARGRVVFVVGHRSWGKSRTLRALTNGVQRYIHLGGVEFFIRRMSNDDRPRKFYALMKRVRPSKTSNLIVAFCPTLEDPQTRRCLEILRRKGYRLFFWVLRQQQKPGTKKFIERGEIQALGKYGPVEIFKNRAEAGRRAKELRDYIQKSVLA